MKQVLTTEVRNPSTVNLDLLPTTSILKAMHAADEEVIRAVEEAIPEITAAVDRIADQMEAGGRLFYLGAGTSGRLGVLDASECPPTFNTPPGLVEGIIAGGDHALRHAVEGAEDDRSRGRQDLCDHHISGQDVLVAIAASGRTPYVLAAIEYARGVGALTIGLTCVPHSLLEAAAEMTIVADTGAEVIAGSTRLKAGTATKMILNMISTTIMVKLGYVYSNLMVNVQPTNEKLKQRAIDLVATLADVNSEDASALLSRGGSVKTAAVMSCLGVDRENAELLLRQAKGRLTAVLAQKTRR